MNEKKIVEIKLEDILPNRFQPRLKFNESAIQELAESIKEHGVIQPIVVRQIADKYEIIAGERRYKASVMAGKATIPAIITDLNDNESAEVALIENVQRQNLTPIEEAISYKKILDMGYLTQDNLATKLVKTQSTIANKLRLLNLEEEVQEALLNGKISERHARSLLKINGQQQIELLNKIINDRLTVRATDLEVEKIIHPNKAQIDENSLVKNNVDYNEIITPIFNKKNESSNLDSVDKNNEVEMIKNLNMPTDPIIEDESDTLSNMNINKNSFDGLNTIDNNNFFTEPSELDNFESIPIENENNKVENLTPSPISPIKLDDNYNFNDSFEPNPIIDENSSSNLQNINGENDENSSSNKFFNFDLISDIENDNNVDKAENQVIETQSNDINKPNSFDLNQSPFTFSPLDTSVSTQDTIQPSENILREPIIFTPINVEEKSNNVNQFSQVRFDGIKNVNPSLPSTSSSTDIRTVINTIRSCANTVQKFGYKVDVQEAEYPNIYQITFEIHKS